MAEMKIALVTGASRGIGQAVAMALAKQGFRVVGTATSESGAQNITEKILTVGGEGQGVVLDVTQQESIDQALAHIRATWGEVSVLVNNAGITRDDLVMRMRDEDWLQVIDANLTSVFRMSRAVLRSMMKARYGRIINIASVVGTAGNAGQTNYAATKAGMVGFSKSLAREVGSRNITVNCVAPGFIDTDMTRAMPEAARTKLIGNIPLGRLGDVGDIAHAVVFLAGEHAGYMTGATLHVNGGMYME